MTLTETLDRLDELNRNATKGPWYTLPGRPSPSHDDHGHRIVADERIYVDRDSAHKSGMGRCTREADLITELRNSYPELSRQVRALIAENEQLKKCLDAERCPNCPDQGWYEVQRGTHLDSEQVQCQWCYENEDSLFNARKALEDSK